MNDYPKHVLIAFLLAAATIMFIACSSSDGETMNTGKTGESPGGLPAAALTPAQSAAFDALNSLQVNSNGHLYSTFVDSQHPCTPPDTSFVLSQAELQIAILQLMAEYCEAISLEEQTDLAATAVLALDDYHIDQCNGSALRMVGDTILSVPTRGTWVMRSVLDRRDVLLEW